jgi:hypothetical protein
MFNRGGTKRFAKAHCGWGCTGSIREANGKLRVHMKYCQICIEYMKQNTCSPTQNTRLPTEDTSDLKTACSLYARKGHKSETSVTIVNPTGIHTYVKVDHSGQQIVNLLSR